MNALNGPVVYDHGKKKVKKETRESTKIFYLVIYWTTCYSGCTIPFIIVTGLVYQAGL
jgi:hypothetical protein